MDWTELVRTARKLVAVGVDKDGRLLIVAGDNQDEVGIVCLLEEALRQFKDGGAVKQDD
jgi:hypothetical protein